MIQDLTGFGARKPAIDPRNQIGIIMGMASFTHEVSRHAKRPINIKGRCHIGLYLGHHMIGWQANHITGIATQLDVRILDRTHMHPGRADGRTSRPCRSGVNTCTKGGHDHIDITKTDRCSGQKTGLRCSLGTQRMGLLTAIKNFGQQMTATFKL